MDRNATGGAMKPETLFDELNRLAIDASIIRDSAGQDDVDMMAATLSEKLIAAACRAEVLERDKARLDWIDLNDRDCYVSQFMGESHDYRFSVVEAKETPLNNLSGYHKIRSSHGTVRAAIDAAMSNDAKDRA